MHEVTLSQGNQAHSDEERYPMKLGLLADIHENTRQLQKAIAVLQQHGAERFVVLGDVFEMGKRIEQTVRLLQEVEAVGVWGNHDVGLCSDPDEKGQAMDAARGESSTFKGHIEKE